MLDEAKAGNTEKLYLSEEELYDLTRYRRPSNQLKMLQSLGIPARMRVDKTVLVLRMHLQYPPSMQTEQKPQLKSSRRLQEMSEKQRK